MYLSPTTDIRVEAAGNDISYALPVRPLGKLRWFGLIPVAFSFLFISVPARSLFDFVQRIVEGRGDEGNLIFAAFLIPFVAVGLFPMWLGLLVICGRCRVDWRDRRLSVLDYVGPIRWRRRLPKGPIRKFTVNSGGTKINDKPVTSGPLADFGALSAEFEQGKPRMVVLGYPRDWLQALARDLSSRVGASASTLAAPEVELVDARENQPQFTDIAEQPADSLVRVESRLNGLSLIIPSAGLKKGSKGLFGFGIFWCLFMLGFTALSGFGEQKAQNVPWGVWLFIAGFWMIGLSMLAGAINMGRRRAVLSVENGKLCLAHAGLFGERRWEWRREDIAAVRADASGMAVNDVPIIELQIHPLNGKKVGFFAGRDDRELRWLATRLRQALKVTAKES